MITIYKYCHKSKVCKLGCVIWFVQHATWIYTLYFVHQLLVSVLKTMALNDFSFTIQPLYSQERAPGTQWIVRWVGWRSRSEIFNACGETNYDSSVFQLVA